MAISSTDFEFITQLIKQKSGISLTPDKEYLLESRLLPVSRQHDLEDINALIAKLRMGGTPELINDTIEAMTTNETSFFRDIKPFELLKQVVLPHINEHSKELKLTMWNAACSSGQEPYSAAMTFKENPQLLNGKSVEMFATDINETIVNKAKEAVYSQFEVQRGLPIAMLMKYFTQNESYGDKWLIKDELKQQIQFSVLNLLDMYTSIPQCDIVFCRNVLIYFEPDLKGQILDKIAGKLKPHGLVMLGSSESITGLTDKLKPLEGQRAVFQLA